MSQDYQLLLGTDTLGASRTLLNNNDEAKKTLFSGASEPSATIRSAYMLWADTTNGVLKQRNSTNTDWFEVANLSAQDWGLLSKSRPGQVVSVSFNMNGQPIEGLGVGSATSAARKQDVDLKAPIASPLLTGDARVNQDPAGGDSIARRSWLEATFVVKATGGVIAGRLGTSSVAAPGANDYLKKTEIAAFTAFDTSAGHRHDGTDGRKIRVPDLELRSFSSFPEVTALGLGEVVKGGWTGDDTNNRLITLPWRPRVVQISAISGLSIGHELFVLAFDVGDTALFQKIDGSGTTPIGFQLGLGNTSRPAFASNGFTVSRISGGSNVGLNDNGIGYEFVAIG